MPIGRPVALGNQAGRIGGRHMLLESGSYLLARLRSYGWAAQLGQQLAGGCEIIRNQRTHDNRLVTSRS